MVGLEMVVVHQSHSLPAFSKYTRLEMVVGAAVVFANESYIASRPLRYTAPVFRLQIVASGVNSCAMFFRRSD